MSWEHFWTNFQRFPPILVRLLAKHQHGPPLTDQEIADASGLPVAQVFNLSCSLTWDGIDIPTSHKFLTGCQMNFENRPQMERVRSYLRAQPTFKYLRTSPHWKPFYEPLVRKWRAGQRLG